jgi:hypothetical protein
MSRYEGVLDASSIRGWRDWCLLYQDVWQWSGTVVAHIQRILSFSALATSVDIGFGEPRIVKAHDGYSSKANVSIGNAMRSELSAQPLEKEKGLYTRHLRLRQKEDRGSRL